MGTDIVRGSRAGAHVTVQGQKGHMVQYMGRRGTVYRGTVYGQLGHTVQRRGWSILYIAVQYRDGRAHCKECRGWSTMYIAVQYMGHTVMATPPT